VGNSLRFLENVLRNYPNGCYIVESNEGIDALENVQYNGEASLATWAQNLVDEFYGENYEDTSAGVLSPRQVPAQEQPNVTVGRGRGAHMTKPAWAK